MMVKICGITTVEDAKICAEAGAGAVGFNFYPKSPRFITAETAAEIAAKTPAGVLKVGLFVCEPAEDVERIARLVGLDVAQIYGDPAPSGIRIWRACRINEFFPAMMDDAEAVLVDTPSTVLLGGTGETFDWALARGLADRVILAGGLDDTNVAAAIEAAQPWGVDACSRLESEPGRKDPEKVRKFVKAALGI